MYVVRLRNKIDGNSSEKLIQALKGSLSIIKKAETKTG